MSGPKTTLSRYEKRKLKEAGGNPQKYHKILRLKKSGYKKIGEQDE
jgi:hypothetical protein